MRESRKITNTTQRVQNDPMTALMEGMIFGGSASIERQEAEGQRELVNSTQIPTDAPPDDLLKAVGFELGPVTDGDPLFRQATLPPGWKKQPTDHSMWSEIVDDKGRKRFSVFYKAAYYDRGAHMHAEQRFRVRTIYPEADYVVKRVVITDCETEIREVGRYAGFDAGDLREQGQRWLDANKPNWKDPAAYWDEA
jgi:hypothetical protein